MKLIAMPLSTIAACFTAVPPAVAQATFTGLGTTGWVTAVSADGSVVVGYDEPCWIFPCGEAFRWTRGGGKEPLGRLPGHAWSRALAVSADGAAIVGLSSCDHPNSICETIAFRWTAAGGIQSLGTLGGQFNRYSEASGVSADGAVVVGSTTVGLGGLQAFRWDGTMQALETLPGGSFSSAVGISADGSVVVGNSVQDLGGGAVESRPFRWTSASGMRELATIPPWWHPVATAVSADGGAVVGGGTNEGSAFRWTSAGGWMDLGTLPLIWYYPRSEAKAVSGDGSVVVGIGWEEDIFGYWHFERAFLWRETLGMMDLNEYLPTLGIDLTGWELTEATGVSADCRTIVGNGLLYGWNSAMFVPWIATIPEIGRRGDLNCDGLVDNEDIDPFVLALTNHAAYAGMWPNCNILNADINCDGLVDNEDIDPLVTCIITGSCPPCP